MASPLIVATTPTPKSTSSTSVLALTGSPQDGEGVLIFVSWDGGTGEVTFTDEHIRLYSLNDVDGYAGGAAAYKQAGVSESSTTTINCSVSTRFAVICFRVSGDLNFSTHPPDFGTVINEGNTVTHNPPSVPVTGGSADILTFATCAYDTYTPTVSSYPNLYTGTGTVQSGASGAQCSMAYCSRSLTAASADPLDYTLSATRRAVNSTVIIQEAAAASLPAGSLGLLGMGK